jgi:hypothetical protein
MSSNGLYDQAEEILPGPDRSSPVAQKGIKDFISFSGKNKLPLLTTTNVYSHLATSQRLVFPGAGIGMASSEFKGQASQRWGEVVGRPWQHYLGSSNDL